MSKPVPKKIALTFSLAPGDVVASTALVRDLKLTYPEMLIDFRTNFPAIFEHNPYLTTLADNDPQVVRCHLDYSVGMKAAMRGDKQHFITAFHNDFVSKIGVPVEPLFSQPDIHLSNHERRNPPISGRYWLLFAGGKSDMTVKHWDFQRYQEVVDRLRSYGIFCVQTGSRKKGHIHPPLKNCLNLVGWGYVRHLIWQVAHADGVICPITCGMHLAAALNKPAVVIAGGRETPSWEHYTASYGAFGPKALPPPVEHRFLHTSGLLDCCQIACYKKKVVKIDSDNSICTKVAKRPPGYQALPTCMDMVSTDLVVEAVMSYYENGTLPPIGKPKEPIA